MILWEHQQQALDLIDKSSLRMPGRSLVILPPGAGKSEIACQAVLTWLRLNHRHRAVVCVPARRLLGQFYQRLAVLTREPIAFEQAARRPTSAHRIILASQLSLIGRLANYSSTDTLLVIDEVHHSNYDAPQFRRVVSRFVRAVGLSATPWTDGINSMFQNSYFYSLSSSISDKIVCPFEIRMAGELTPADDFHTLVFVSSNAEARNKSEKFAGADWIGHTRDDGKNLSVISRWRKRQIKILFSNRMLLEGYDTPETSTVWIDHRLDSVVMCAQILGRALRYRPHKKAVIYVTNSCTLSSVNEAIRLMDSGPT